MSVIVPEEPDGQVKDSVEIIPPMIFREWLRKTSPADLYNQLCNFVYSQDAEMKKAAVMLHGFISAKEPFVHICGKRFVDRVETINEIKVYSNQDTVTLYANGKKVATKTGSRVFTFKVHNLGEMKLEAVAGKLRDSAVIRHVTKPNMSYKLAKDGGNGGNWT